MATTSDGSVPQSQVTESLVRWRDGDSAASVSRELTTPRQLLRHEMARTVGA
jgi:hypothetical protein